MEQYHVQNFIESSYPSLSNPAPANPAIEIEFDQHEQGNGGDNSSN